MLFIILSSGAEALAALSMDQIQLPNGQRLSVSLRSPDWAELYCEKLSRLFQENSSSLVQNGSMDNLRTVNINLDGSMIVLGEFILSVSEEDEDEGGTSEMEALNNAFSDF